jgi:RhoGAP domain
MLHMVSLLLPKCNRDTLEVISVFLKWVASFAHMDEETGSKMDLQNLATVICPSILYSRGRDPARDESFGAIRVVSYFLENQDVYYTVPEEFLPILHDQDYFISAMDLPTKDFVKKCEMYLRLKANGKAPAPTSPGPNNGGYNPSPSMSNLPPTGRSGDNLSSIRYDSSSIYVFCWFDFPIAGYKLKGRPSEVHLLQNRSCGMVIGSSLHSPYITRLIHIPRRMVLTRLYLKASRLSTRLNRER